MQSVNIEDFEGGVYNLTLRGKLDISQSFDITRPELNKLKEIRNHLDEADYTYISDDGVITYKNGTLTLYFEVNNETDLLNTNTITITNVREFLDKL